MFVAYATEFRSSRYAARSALPVEKSKNSRFRLRGSEVPACHASGGDSAFGRDFLRSKFRLHSSPTGCLEALQESPKDSPRPLRDRRRKSIHRPCGLARSSLGRAQRRACRCGKHCGIAEPWRTGTMRPTRFQHPDQGMSRVRPQRSEILRPISRSGKRFASESKNGDKILSRNRSDIHREPRRVGHDVDFAAALDDSDTKRWRSQCLITLRSEIRPEVRDAECRGHPSSSQSHFRHSAAWRRGPPGRVLAASAMTTPLVGMDDLQRSVGSPTIAKSNFSLAARALAPLLAQPPRPSIRRTRFRGRGPARCRGIPAARQAWRPSKPLVSDAPRPQTLPSRRSAEKGSIVIPATLTVSVCGASSKRGFDFPSEGKRPRTFGRPGGTSSTLASALAGPEKFGDEICTILFTGAGGAGVAIGIDARNTDQLAEEIGGGHCFSARRYQSMNLGMPSEILTFG